MTSGFQASCHNVVSLFSVLALAAVAGCGSAGGAAPGGPAEVAAARSSDLPDGPVTEAQVLRGRQLVLNHDCGSCHGGGSDPAAEGWLAGNSEQAVGGFGDDEFWPRNLTPDDETGLGRVSERQIFNALRYGLRPTETLDVEVTSMIPGEGNHPENPDYLGRAMPWFYFRFMSDGELWDIAAYLKHGLKPVRHEVPKSDAPADKWASEYTVEKIGTHVLPPFPAAREELRTPEEREQVLRGRKLVAGAACSGCHGGAKHPDQEDWLSGETSEGLAFPIRVPARLAPRRENPMVFERLRGDSAAFSVFTTRPRNLTPHNTTGIGRFSERQIFNALRYGLRPGETADVEITSTTPGEGNFPVSPKYLAPPMPWPAWRHFSDQELWDIAAYLKHGLKPVEKRVPDSEGPPDFWRSGYEEFLGPYPPPPFPTANEVAVTGGR